MREAIVWKIIARYKIYLAGHITPDPETLGWRTKAYDELSVFFDINSPLRGKDELYQDNTFIATQGMMATASSSRSIILRDYNDVVGADIILVNLQQYGNRPLQGTLFELAWAYDHKIPVVAFGASEQLRQHPFIVESVTEFHPDLNSAIRQLVQYWR